MIKALFKLDSKKKVRFWSIHNKGSKLIQQSGLLDGKKVEHTKICTGKNIGKSNETTPKEQALLELESEYKSKLDEGYFPTIKEAEEEEVILPMLAKSYEDYAKKISWESAFVQPKLDGMRCLAHIKANGDVTLVSRDGKVIGNMEHIMDDLSTIKSDTILDGELYAHGLTFQENMKLIKKYRPNETEKIKYHVYDLIDYKKDMCFDERYELLAGLVDPMNTVERVRTLMVNSENDLKYLHGVNIANGYEGSILRHGLDGYKVNGRSSSLLKYKDFQDTTVKIHDVVPADQRPEWGQFIFYWKGAKGHPYGDDYIGCGMKFSHEERKEILLNKQEYIGKTAELRYFEKSDSGVLRFPICVGIRLDK